ncbi:MAG: LD-carboxypeptidase [Bdellovibrio sp. CG10_big_fil_rev_8_21_14_0_10_47_8]|nr:MAG: LD-carboxypeptidase [Bdellovibrio sp. CG10_big_fil_rev_8_21_14_0_10_47_8]
MSKKPSVKGLKLLSGLKAGDLVDIVSPGSSSRMDDVDQALELIESWGLRARLPKETFSAHPFHSNEDSVRLKLLKKALLAKDSKMVWCLRGGYGANRLLPELWKMKAPAKTKILMGYSDITSLLFWLNQKWKWTSLHGPLLESLISGRLAISQIEECRRILFGEQKEQVFAIQPMNMSAKKIKQVRAAVTGGNLVVLDSSVGTPFDWNPDGKIIILEEVGERGYRVDRMLEHLRQAKKLDKVKAVIFGDFLGGEERDGSTQVSFALERFAYQSKVPCFSGLETGHGAANRILSFGSVAELSPKTLTLDTGIQGDL